MSSLKYIGPTASNPRDLVNGSYVTNLLATNLSQGTVDSLISTALSPYALKSYVDQQDALNANKTYVDNGDSTRLHLSQRNVANGVAGLDSTGRIDRARLPDISTQRFPSPYWSPSAYNATTVNTVTEGALYTCAVADPGYTYKLLIFGVAHTTMAADTGEYPVINVRLGSTTGPIIASGYGLAEQNLPARTYLTTPGTYTYPIPSLATILDCVVLGGGGAGYPYGWVGKSGSGDAGHWASVRLIRGTNIPLNTTSLTLTVGAGGHYNNPIDGGNSVVSGTGMTTLTGAGGEGQDPYNSYGGHGPGNYSFQGVAYTGGADQTQENSPGNPPGGGGCSGGTNCDGAAGLVVITPSGVSAQAIYSSTKIVSVPLTYQAALTGAQTLYIRLKCSGTVAPVTATTTKPSLWCTPIPV